MAAHRASGKDGGEGSAEANQNGHDKKRHPHEQMAEEGRESQWKRVMGDGTPSRDGGGSEPQKMSSHAKGGHLDGGGSA